MIKVSSARLGKDTPNQRRALKNRTFLLRYIKLLTWILAETTFLRAILMEFCVRELSFLSQALLEEFMICSQDLRLS